jgi:predicted nucleic acid-binding protein
MQRIIVSDTSCLILLHKVNLLHLLKELFGHITITQVVAKEYNDHLPDFIHIRDPQNLHAIKILETLLDSGEASVIALALELEDCLLIMDEVKGRQKAKSLGVKVTGTLGILLLAKEKKLLKAIKPVLQQIEKTNFRISRLLINRTLQLAGEAEE